MITSLCSLHPRETNRRAHLRSTLYPQPFINFCNGSANKEQETEVLTNYRTFLLILRNINNRYGSISDCVDQIHARIRAQEEKKFRESFQEFVRQ